MYLSESSKNHSKNVFLADILELKRSVVRDQAGSIWQAYICFIDLIGWRPRRSIEMISSSIDPSHLMTSMTPVPAGMLHKASLKQM